MQVGIDSFAGYDPETGQDRSDAMAQLVERIVAADRIGLDVFGIGEHHRADSLDSAPPMILAAAAAVTNKIRLTSAVTVLSAADPVRVFQEFATLDLLSRGRAEVIVGRGSSTEGFPLFGIDMADYEEIFDEKLGLLLELRKEEKVRWAGRFRPALTGQGVYPRPVQPVLPVWVGVGGTPRSFARAGILGLPLMVAVIGGETAQFAPLVELYRKAGAQAGHPPETLQVGLHSLGYVAETSEKAASDYFPGYSRRMNKIGRERGWPPLTRETFEQQIGPRGALLVGAPAEVASKIKRHSEALGGIDRVTFQMDGADVPHADTIRAIELIGDQVAAVLRG